MRQFFLVHLKNDSWVRLALTTVIIAHQNIQQLSCLSLCYSFSEFATLIQAITLPVWLYHLHMSFTQPTWIDGEDNLLLFVECPCLSFCLSLSSLSCSVPSS